MTEAKVALPRVVLQPRRARPFFGRHPWVYAGAVAAVTGDPPDGAVVDLMSHAGNFVARGLINRHSKIRVRLYSWDADLPLDRDFFKGKIEAALNLRRLLDLDGPGRACRLIFSEGDGLSGLTVDRYDRRLVVQFTSLGLAQRRDMITELLVELLQPESVTLRTERGIGKLEGLELQDGLLWGSPPTERVTIEENGLKYLVDVVEGQKTGFYSDQRDNRLAAAKLARNRRVLDAFCYTGGFGLCAARAGASAVLGVDVSEPALEIARANAKLNGLDQVVFERHEVFDKMEALYRAGEKFGVVILDPPKFARSRNAVDEAMRGYRRLQSLALRLIEADGFLVICCCSGLITMAMLEELLSQLAVDEKREVQILERRGQALDHPVSAACPESNYLKCLVCAVR
jgi:23S rRNA (cytosine1962-C5)-methyltransferase